MVYAINPICEPLGTPYPAFMVCSDIVQIVLDPSRPLPMKRGALSPKQMDLHRQAKRLCHSLHLERYQKFAKEEKTYENRWAAVHNSINVDFYQDFSINHVNS